MGLNIFNIQQNYLDLINQIEIADGEVTADIEELLAVTQEDFANKMNSYREAIVMLESEITVAKKEIERITSKFKAKENTIDRLKKVMIQALQLMGDTGKTGNKTLKTDKYNFYTVNKAGVEVDPLVCTIQNDQLEEFLNVKLSLKLTPLEYSELRSAVDQLEQALDEDGAPHTKVNEIVNTATITIEPDKKKLLEYLQIQEARKKELPLDTGQYDEGGNILEEPLLRGVKLITNVSLNVK